MQNPSRRLFTGALAGTMALSMIPGTSRASESVSNGDIQGQKFNFDLPSDRPKPKVAMLMFPGLTLLDLIGPQTTLADWCDVHLVWKNTDLIMSDTGVVLRPDTTLAECPKDLDVLFVPGGPGQVEPMEDSAVLDFLADRGSRAKYVTSVCSGALVLGAAGLLKGYKSTTHWGAMQALPMFGATPVDERVVIDRNRISGGGVTAGIDFGLTLLAILLGEDAAQTQQLGMQYDPQPPYDCGHPSKASPEQLQRSLERMRALGIGGADMIETLKKAAGNMDDYAKRAYSLRD